MSNTYKKPAVVNEAFKNKKILNTISEILNDVLEDNKNLKCYPEVSEKHNRLPFYSTIPASVSIGGYIERITKYTHCEESTLIASLIYIDRMCELNNIYLMQENIHRIVFASIILAIKYNEDDYYTNNYYSKVGGIIVKEFNLLEYELLKSLKYCLYIKCETFEKYRNYLNHYSKK
jgi:hypothetical protein